MSDSNRYVTLFKNIRITPIVALGLVLVAVFSIIILIFNLQIKYKYQTKWQTLQAQQANLNTLTVAKQMFYKNLLARNCTNTAKCAFWDGNRNIHLTHNNAPNKNWWYSNGYSINNSNNNSKFIIITKPNNRYKIIAFSEDRSGSQAVISCEYI